MELVCITPNALVTSQYSTFEPNWQSSFMNVYDTDCSDLLKSDARGIIGLSHSRDEMNVICESPTISKFALSVSKFLLFNNKYEELLTT